MTSREEIREWLERGKAQGATHMFVVCDTYDWDDYPVYKTGDADTIREAAEKGYPRDTQKLMEVYRLDMDFEAQLGQHRALNY